MDITATVTAHNAVELADQISEAFQSGDVTKLFGSDELVKYFGQPVARSWQNGTVSVTVKARSGRGVNNRYFKVGKTISVS